MQDTRPWQWGADDMVSFLRKWFSPPSPYDDVLDRLDQLSSRDDAKARLLRAGVDALPAVVDAMQKGRRDSYNMLPEILAKFADQFPFQAWPQIQQLFHSSDTTGRLRAIKTMTLVMDYGTSKQQAVRLAVEAAASESEDLAHEGREFLDACLWRGYCKMSHNPNANHLDPKILAALASHEDALRSLADNASYMPVQPTASRVLRALSVAREEGIIETDVKDGGRIRKYRYRGQPEGKRLERGEVQARSRAEALAKLRALRIEVRALEEVRE